MFVVRMSLMVVSFIFKLETRGVALICVPSKSSHRPDDTTHVFFTNQSIEKQNIHFFFFLFQSPEYSKACLGPAVRYRRLGGSFIG